MPSFLNATFLGWTALASIPVIIYLINRQRYRRVPWAAMEFLLRAMQKNRRRLRLENLLLLIIRTVAILLLVMAFARPMFDAGALPVLGGPKRAEIIVIDRSYSMAVLEGSRPVLAQAVERAKARVSSYSKGDRYGLFLAGGYPESRFEQSQVMTDGALPQVLAELESVEVIFEPVQVATTLQRVAEWVERDSTKANWAVHFYTDVQSRDWTGEEGAADGAIRDALSRFETLSCKLHVHPMGPTKPRNATLLSLVCDDALLTADLPTSFHVRVANTSREALAGLEVELWINEALQGSRKVSLDPGEERGVSFPHVFREVELARVQAVLKSDDLIEDNTCHAVFDVRDAIDILVVDGGRASADSEETAWLLPAIGADLTTETSSERLTPFHCDVINPDMIVGTDLDKYEVMVLADVGTFVGDDNKVIGEFVEKGGGVLVFAGDRVDPTSYRRAYDDGAGWFPYAIGREIVFNPTEIAYELIPSAKEHPAAEYLASTEEAGLGLTRIHGYWGVETEPPEGSVLFKLNDFRGTPFVTEKPFGQGTTLVVNTGADRVWSNLPITPAFVCLIQESLPYLAARADVPRNLGINEPYQRVLGSEEYADPVYLFSPDATSYRITLTNIDQTRFSLGVDGQRAPGIYEIRMGRQKGEGTESNVRSDWFAVNSDPVEGNLSRTNSDELAEAYASEVLNVLEHEPRSDNNQVQQSTGEIWRALLWGVLVLIILESVLARWFGRIR